jgi:6-phosphogluconolactonase
MSKHLFLFILIANGVLVAPSNVGADSNHWLFVSLLEDQRIVTFRRDADSGSLTRVTETRCPAEPAGMAGLALAPDLSILLVSFRSSGQLASYRIDHRTGQLTPLNIVEGGADPAYLLPDRTGRFLIVAYYLANKVTIHAIESDGRVGRLVQTLPTAEKAHGLALDASNRFLFVPHTGANRIYQFRFRNGRLTPNDPAFVSTPTGAAGDHPRHVALHPSDRWAYINNEAGDSLGVYDMDRSSGTLKRVQTATTLPEGFDGTQNSTARCQLTPDGRFVYVANRGHDSIACFSIDPASGRVASLGQVPTEKTPRCFTIERQGRFMYVAGQNSGRVATYRIQADGQLHRVATTSAGPVSWWVIAVDTPLD